MLRWGRRVGFFVGGGRGDFGGWWGGDLWVVVGLEGRIKRRGEVERYLFVIPELMGVLWLSMILAVLANTFDIFVPWNVIVTAKIHSCYTHDLRQEETAWLRKACSPFFRRKSS